MQVANSHAPELSNGHSEEQDSHENLEDLMSQLNALSTK